MNEGDRVIYECPLCRDTGHVVDFDGGVTVCPSETCLKERAAALLGVEPDRVPPGIFKGGTFKMSVGIKGFELTHGEQKVLADVLKGNDEFKKLVGIEEPDEEEKT